MSYKYEWKSNGFILKLWDTLSIRELVYINDIWKRRDTISSIEWQVWDFTNADLQYIFESDMQDPEVTLTIDKMRLVLVAKNPYTRLLLGTYINRSKELGSKWDMHLVSEYEEAISIIGDIATNA